MHMYDAHLIIRAARMPMHACTARRVCYNNPEPPWKVKDRPRLFPTEPHSSPASLAQPSTGDTASHCSLDTPLP